MCRSFLSLVTLRKMKTVVTSKSYLKVPYSLDAHETVDEAFLLSCKVYPKRQGVAPLVLDSRFYIPEHEKISTMNHSLDFTCSGF